MDSRTANIGKKDGSILERRTAEYWKEGQQNIGKKDGRILERTAEYWKEGRQNIGKENSTVEC